MLLLPLSLFLFIQGFALAGTQGPGTSCSVGNNHLDPGTNQFDGDCGPTTYCGPDGTCDAKGCRRDEYPFGYPQDDPNLPPRCPTGQFCPDEEDQCQDLLPVGSPCQLNRDDECEPPPDASELSSSQNVNGSICLNYQCMWSNVSLGLPCIVENTPYIAYTSDSEFIYVVSRGNCRPGLYCDASAQTCMQTKDFGVSCTADKECESDNCTPAGTCGVSPDSPTTFPKYVFVIVGFGIVAGGVGTMFGLFFVHRRARDEAREQRTQYWREQNAFRQNIMQMRETAQASLLSLPYNNTSPRSSGGYHDSRDMAMSDDGLGGMLPSPTKGSSHRPIGFNTDDDDQTVILDDTAVLNMDVRSSRRRPSRKFTR